MKNLADHGGGAQNAYEGRILYRGALFESIEDEFSEIEADGHTLADVASFVEETYIKLTPRTRSFGLKERGRNNFPKQAHRFREVDSFSFLNMPYQGF